jgi:hypothetical protein
MSDTDSKLHGQGPILLALDVGLRYRLPIAVRVSLAIVCENRAREYTYLYLKSYWSYTLLATVVSRALSTRVITFIMVTSGVMFCSYVTTRSAYNNRYVSVPISL